MLVCEEIGEGAGGYSIAIELRFRWFMVVHGGRR